MSALHNYIQSHRERFLAELFDLLRIPSISADHKYQKETRAAATFIKEKITQAGADTAYLIETKGQPIVYAEKTIDPILPTILIYGHYDVQPPDPLAQWTSPPFQPTIRDGNIYARGASDDKGQLYAHIKAFESMLATDQLSCNVKFLIEGEEEIGSPSIAPFLADTNRQELIQSDVVLISDTSMPHINQPVIPIGLRGIIMCQITLSGPNRDLHSGNYGGAVNNPIHALCALIATLRDENHQITIPHFYDHVLELSPDERSAIALPFFDEKAYQKDLGLSELVGEKGYTTLERLGIRPTLEVNGIWGGTIGTEKTILPAQAHAIISMRLVPNQNPPSIIQSLKKYIQHLHQTLAALRGTQVTIQETHCSAPLLIPPQSKAIQAIQKAFQTTWGGKSPLPIYTGGSIPLLTDIHQKLHTDIALLGLGLDHDNIHSPNEKFGVENYFKGIQTITAFYHAFAQNQ